VKNAKEQQMKRVNAIFKQSVMDLSIHSSNKCYIDYMSVNKKVISLPGMVEVIERIAKLHKIDKIADENHDFIHGFVLSIILFTFNGLMYYANLYGTVVKIDDSLETLLLQDDSKIETLIVEDFKYHRIFSINTKKTGLKYMGSNIHKIIFSCFATNKSNHTVVIAAMGSKGRMLDYHAITTNIHNNKTIGEYIDDYEILENGLRLDKTAMKGMFSLVYYCINTFKGYDVLKENRESEFQSVTDESREVFINYRHTVKQKHIQLGTKIGVALRKIEKYNSECSTNTQRPHVRRAHWHTYHYGKGRTKTKKLFLVPILCNAELLEDN